MFLQQLSSRRKNHFVQFFEKRLIGIDCALFVAVPKMKQALNMKTNTELVFCGLWFGFMCGFMFVVCCCLLFVVCCLLFVVCCLLFVVCCLLFVLLLLLLLLLLL